jgi:hypothetical protein
MLLQRKDGGEQQVVEGKEDVGPKMGVTTRGHFIVEGWQPWRL